MNNPLLNSDSIRDKILKWLHAAEVEHGVRVVYAFY